MLSAVNQPLLEQIEGQQVEVELVPVRLVASTPELKGELEQMWSFVQKKENQRWLWHAIDHGTGKVLA